MLRILLLALCCLVVCQGNEMEERRKQLRKPQKDRPDYPEEGSEEPRGDRDRKMQPERKDRLWLRDMPERPEEGSDEPNHERRRPKKPFNGELIRERRNERLRKPKKDRPDYPEEGSEEPRGDRDRKMQPKRKDRLWLRDMPERPEEGSDEPNHERRRPKKPFNGELIREKRNEQLRKPKKGRPDHPEEGSEEPRGDRDRKMQPKRKERLHVRDMPASSEEPSAWPSGSWSPVSGYFSDWYFSIPSEEPSEYNDPIDDSTFRKIAKQIAELFDSTWDFAEQYKADGKKKGSPKKGGFAKQADGKKMDRKLHF